MDTLLSLIALLVAAFGAFWLGRRSSGGTAAAPALQVPVTGASNSSLLPTQRAQPAVTVKTDQGSLMEIRPQTGMSLEDIERSWTPMKSGKLGDLLSPLVGALPNLGLAQQVGSKTLMEVQVAGALAQAADGNGFRGIVIENGRITEHARLFSADGVQMATAGVAVWQIASIIVAQKHLADISKQLGAINKKLDDVKKFLDDKRRATVEAAGAFVRDVVEAMSEQHPTPQDADTVAKEELKIAQIQLHLVKDLEALRVTPENQLEAGTFGSSSEFYDLKQRYKRAKELSDAHDLTHRTRIALIFARAMMLEGEAMVRLRLKDAEATAKQFMDLHKDLLSHFQQQAESLDAKTTSSSETKRRKEDIALLTQLSETCRHALEQDLQALSFRVDGAIRSAREPVRALMEVSDGRVSNLYTPAALN